MDTRLAKAILAELTDVGTLAVTFTGGGEPTMHPNFIEIVREAFKLGLKLGLYTHGVDVSRLLPVLGCFSWVFVSLDDSDPQAYAEHRGRDAWRDVIANIGLLGQRGTTIGVGFLIHGGNWQRISDMIALELNCDYKHFRPVVGLEDYDWVKPALPILEAISLRNDVTVSMQRFLDLWDNSRKLYRRGYSKCRACALTPCIGADGTLWVCPNTRGLRKIGDLKTQTFRDAWAQRTEQLVGDDCRIACRNHDLNVTLEYICSEGVHQEFV